MLKTVGIWRVLLLGLMALSWLFAVSGCDLASDDGKLKIGLLPILDVLPLYVADQEGFFRDEGVQVELVPFASALERDVAFQAGQIDGEVNDLVSTALLNKDQDRARVVRTAMRATPEKAMFVTLASGKNSISKPADLKGVEVAVSMNTVIEYAVDRLLQAEGLAPGDIAKTDVPKIPVRLELLDKGNVAAACLPEPLASLAVVNGARIVVDDRSHPEYGQSVVTVSTGALARKPAAMKRFLSAYERAVAAINAQPEKYRSLLIDKGRVPKPVQNSFQMPVFPQAGVPAQSEVNDVLQWMKGKSLLNKDLPYDQLVTDSYLPKRN